MGTIVCLTLRLKPGGRPRSVDLSAIINAIFIRRGGWVRLAMWPKDLPK
jgi:hypothetical protein